MRKPIDDFCLQLVEVKKLNDIFQYNQRVLTAGVDISGLLRAQIVFVVSLLDNYIHRVILFETMNILQNQRPTSQSFGKLTLGLDSVNMLINGSNAVDSYALIEQEIQHNLSWRSFQQPDKIAEILRSVCDKKVWNEIEALMGRPAVDIKEQLQLIVKRRDSIVHEADFDVVNQCQYEITGNDTKKVVNFVISLVFMIDSVVFNYSYDDAEARQQFIS